MMLQKFARLFPRAIIARPNGLPYMARYFLWRGKRLGIFVHQLLSDDPDDALHDHPWDWAFSLILKGSYSEERQCEGGWKIPPRTWSRKFSPGQINRIRGTTFHRLTLALCDTPVWTLFIHGPRTKKWGFIDRTGQYREYTGPRTEDLATGGVL